MKKRMLADSLMYAAKKAQPENPMADFFKGIGVLVRDLTGSSHQMSSNPING